MKQFAISLFLVLTIPFSLTAQTNDGCKCCTPQHEQFDFWVGDWVVFNEEGEKIGENLIVKEENNCLISETWQSSNGTSGQSMNYYNPADSTWNQLWISCTGNILKLKGKAGKDKMILKSDMVDGEKDKYYNQITWTLNPDGSVTQHWELLDANGNFLSDAFKGTYISKDSTAEK